MNTDPLIDLDDDDLKDVLGSDLDVDLSLDTKDLDLCNDVKGQHKAAETHFVANKFVQNQNSFKGSDFKSNNKQ